MAPYPRQLNLNLPISISERRPTAQKFYREVKVLNQLVGCYLWINRSYDMESKDLINSALTIVRDILRGLNFEARSANCLNGGSRCSYAMLQKAKKNILIKPTPPSTIIGCIGV